MGKQNHGHLCLLAVFAKDSVLKPDGIDLDTAFPVLQISGPLPPGAEYTRLVLSLHVFLMASEGEHILTYSLSGLDSTISQRFTIRPEHENFFLVKMTGEWPVALGSQDAPVMVTAYKILLDGEPLTTVHLASQLIG